MSSNDNKEKLKQLLEENSKEGKITCSSCHEISEKHSYVLKEIGEMADEIGLKIVNCKLGCF